MKLKDTKSLSLGIIITAICLGVIFFITFRVEAAKKKGERNVLYWEDAVASVKVEPTEDLLIEGERLFQTQCSICHGLSGQGNGHASIFLGVKPRDFTSEGYKFQTTSGSLPSDDDLFRTVTVGFPAYGMPGFHYLSEEDRWAIVHYVKTFNEKFKDKESPQLVDLGKEPKSNPELIAQGQEIFEQAGCYTCHGRTGKGDGPSSATLKDNQGRPILALDLTRGGIYFKGGDRPRDMARTFTTGLKGTPMPSYADAGFTKKQLWMLAHFLKSLSSNYEQGQ